MEQNPNQSTQVPQASAEFGDVRNDAAGFRTVPNDAEAFGTTRNDAEGFRSGPHPTERNENHTLTVREVARMFEAAGVARTERSIVNWCQANRTGIARLDSYFDPNERKYFISRQSMELAIAEEKAKAAKNNEAAETFGTVPPGVEDCRSVPNTAETVKKAEIVSAGDAHRHKELEQENMNLQILNQGKDFLINELNKERKSFFEQLLSANRKMGELENRLLQLGDA